MRSVSLVHYHNLNRKTKSNILNFLKKRIKETSSDSRSEGEGVQIKLLKEISLLIKEE
jgi:hypothetical protein